MFNSGAMACDLSRVIHSAIVANIFVGGEGWEVIGTAVEGCCLIIIECSRDIITAKSSRPSYRELVGQFLFSLDTIFVETMIDA